MFSKVPGDVLLTRMATTSCKQIHEIGTDWRIPLIRQLWPAILVDGFQTTFYVQILFLSNFPHSDPTNGLTISPGPQGLGRDRALLTLTL